MTDAEKRAFAAGIEAAKQQVIFALEETAEGDETVTPEMATLVVEIVERFCALTPSAPVPTHHTKSPASRGRGKRGG